MAKHPLGHASFACPQALILTAVTHRITYSMPQYMPTINHTKLQGLCFVTTQSRSTTFLLIVLLGHTSFTCPQALVPTIVTCQIAYQTTQYIPTINCSKPQGLCFIATHGRPETIPVPHHCTPIETTHHTHSGTPQHHCTSYIHFLRCLSTPPLPLTQLPHALQADPMLRLVLG